MDKEGAGDKASAGEKDMTPEERIELAALLEEERFRWEHRIRPERATTVINGVERTILVVKFKLRPVRGEDGFYDA